MERFVVSLFEGPSNLSNNSYVCYCECNCDGGCETCEVDCVCN